jgi:uncharacterized RDD family membrane protein YckC
MEVSVSELASARPRAGFWRRFCALLVDSIVVTVPIQLIVVVLYAMSDGAVQINSGVVFTHCQVVSRWPEGLDPPPPAGSNFARACRASFFGLETARWLVVGRVTQEGIVTKTISRTYRLGRDGKVRSVTSLDWIALLGLLVYVVAMECRFGATLGKWLLQIRTWDIAEPGHVGIPLRKAVLRNLLIWVGIVPMLVVLIVSTIVNEGDLESVFGGSFFAWFAAAAALGIVWNLWVVIEIARKRDPIYDRIAGTVVLREPST